MCVWRGEGGLGGGVKLSEPSHGPSHFWISSRKKRSTSARCNARKHPPQGHSGVIRTKNSVARDAPKGRGCVGCACTWRRIVLAWAVKYFTSCVLLSASCRCVCVFVCVCVCVCVTTCVCACVYLFELVSLQGGLLQLAPLQHVPLLPFHLHLSQHLHQRPLQDLGAICGARQGGGSGGGDKQWW